MSEGSQFSLTNFSRKKAFQPDEQDVLLEFALLPSLIADPHLKTILAANNLALKTSGYSRSELLGLNLTALFSNWDPAYQRTLLQDHSFDPLQPISLVMSRVELIRRDSSRIAFHLSLTRLSSKGKRILLTLHDPGAERKKELDRHRNEQLWSHLLEMASAFVQEDYPAAIQNLLTAGAKLMGADGLAVFEAKEQIPGLKRSTTWGNAALFPLELPPEDLIKLGRPTEWKVGKRLISQLHRSARAAQMTQVLSAPLGPPTAAIGLLTAVYGQSEPPAQALQTIQFLAALITDLVDHTILNQSSRQSHLQHLLASQQSAVLEASIHEGCIVLNREFNIIGINPPAEKLLGYQHREVIGFRGHEILSSPDFDLFTILSSLNTHTPTRQIVSLYHRGGVPFPVLLQVLPVFNQERLERVLILFEDLTQKQALEEHNHRLQELALLGEMTARFAHEVRNPLNAISTGLDLMEEMLSKEDPNQDTIARLRSEGMRINSMMDSILSYSRAKNYEMEVVDLEALLKRVLDRSSIKKQKTVQIQREISCPPLYGNAHALEQVFTNLITNAIQAMGSKGGQLVIKGQPIGMVEGRPMAEITLADTGPGILPENVNKIFDAFYTTKASGTGLGLAVTHKIIQEHQGTIRVESFVGGTVFFLRLPLAKV